MSVTGSFGGYGDSSSDDMLCGSRRSVPMTPLIDRTNQPSTLRFSQLATMTTPSQSCIAFGEQDVPMSHGQTSAFSPVRNSKTPSDQSWHLAHETRGFDVENVCGPADSPTSQYASSRGELNKYCVATNLFYCFSTSLFHGFSSIISFMDEGLALQFDW